MPGMKELNFDHGLVTFNVNGRCEVTFNPTDTVFAQRLYDAFDHLDQKQVEYKAEIEKIADKKEIFDFARERDKEMREIIDGLFGKPICADLFGSMSLYALSGGLPVWCNFMFAVMDEMADTADRERQASAARIAKYTAKYKK